MPLQEITAERPPPPSGERTSSARDGSCHTAQARASPLMSCGPCRDVHQGQDRLAALLPTRTHQTPPPTILLPRSEPSRTVHARIVLQELVKRFLVLLDLSFHRFFLSCLILAASASSNSARDVVAAWSCSFAKILRKGQTSRKRQAARPEIKTSGLLEHVSLAGTSPLGYHRGVPLGWRERPFDRSTPDILTTAHL